MTTAPKRKIVLVLFFARFQTLLWKILDISRWVWYNRYVVNRGVAQLVARVVWERVTASWADRRKLVKSPFFSRFLAFLPSCASTKNFWPQIWPLTNLTQKLNIFTNRGVAQLVAREVWDFDAVGSNPATPTKNQPKMRFSAPLSACFLLTIGFYPPLRQIRLMAEKRLVP